MSKNGPFLALLMNFLSTQNVNLARFARYVEWDFFCDFQTPWVLLSFSSQKPSFSGLIYFLIWDNFGQFGKDIFGMKIQIQLKVKLFRKVIFWGFPSFSQVSLLCVFANMTSEWSGQVRNTATLLMHLLSFHLSSPPRKKRLPFRCF